MEMQQLTIVNEYNNQKTIKPRGKKPKFQSCFMNFEKKCRFFLIYIIKTTILYNSSEFVYVSFEIVLSNDKSFKIDSVYT